MNFRTYKYVVGGKVVTNKREAYEAGLSPIQIQNFDLFYDYIDFVWLERAERRDYTLRIEKS